ncbi:hypothetical protein IAD21_03751 [Abditibacteriota bacterium]|nr:hypothetical protein IAD21_03751 [Abditibacteriota bacterium]
MPFEFDSYTDTSQVGTQRLSLKLYDRDHPGFYDEAPCNTTLARNGDFQVSFALSKLGTGDGHYYKGMRAKMKDNNAGSNLYVPLGQPAHFSCHFTQE